jgi:ketosteroid isomerase-like protein
MSEAPEPHGDLTQRQRENLELVRAGFEAFNAGDIAAVLELLDPEIEVFTAPGLINAGTFHGHAGFLEWAQGWLEAWESTVNEIERLHPIGEDRVVVEAHQRARGAGSGIDVEMDNTWLFEIRNGKATRLHLYDDREEAFAAAERLSHEPGA